MKRIVTVLAVAVLGAGGCASVTTGEEPPQARAPVKIEYLTGSRIKQRSNAHSLQYVTTPDANTREELFGNKAGFQPGGS